MPKTAEELRAERQKTQDRARELVDLAKREEREFTDEESAEFDACTQRSDELDPLINRAERVERVEAASAKASNREDGSPKSPEFKRQADDPYADLDRIERHQVDNETLMSRAQTAIDNTPKRYVSDAGRDHMHRMLEQFDEYDPRGADVARHILLTGSPEYEREFRIYLRSNGSIMGPEMQRAALSLSAGSALIPLTLDPTINITNAGIVDPIRSISHVETITTNTWNGVTSAGVNVAVIGENTAVTDQTPTVAAKQIPVYKFAAWVFGSWEVLGDTNFGAQLPRLIADGKARIEGQKFAVGSGSSEPTGVVTAVRAVTTSRVGAGQDGSLKPADVFNVSNAMTPRYAPGASWLANKATFNTIRQFSTVTSGGAFWTDLGMGRPANLIGSSTYEASSMDSVQSATTSSLLLACDMSMYYVIDRVGMTLTYDQNIYDTTTGAPKGQAGWVAWWRVGADLVDPGAGRLLRATSSTSGWV